MEYYQVFLKVVLKEIARFNLNKEVYSTFLNRLTASLDGNFDVSYNRCAFMHKYASNCIYFFKDCVNLFLLDNIAKDMLSEWKHYSEVNVCSLSIGPGLDYLAFVLAIIENDPLPPNFAGATIISKHGAWRNTINFLLEVFREQDSIFEVGQSKLKYNNMKVVQADLFKTFSEKCTIESLSDAHVVLMMKTLNVLASGTPQEGPILNMLKGLISTLKSDAVIFCIDTKPSLALLSQALSNFPGKFLYGPIHRSIKLPDDFPEVKGCHPVMSTRGIFFVWQKLSSFPSMTSLSTTLDMAPVSIEHKSKTLASDTNISSLSASIIDEANEDRDSDNVPWIELKTFWQSSSPATKKILKKLMLSDVKSQEQMGDTNFQVEVDLKKNDHLNITRTELLGGAEVLTSVNEESILTTDDNVKNAYDSLSLTETLNKINSLIHENITSYSKIEETNPVSDFKEPNSYDMLSRNKVNSGEATIFRDAGPSENEVKSANVLDSKPIAASTFSKILTKQIDHFVNVSIDVPANNNSIKTNIDSEEYTIEKDAAVISPQEKVIQTDSHKCTNSPSIRELTDSIRHLVHSLESRIEQNERPDFKICNRSPNRSHEHHFAPNSNINDNVPSCPTYSSNYGPTKINNFSCANEKKAFQCIDCSCKNYCCHNRCNIVQPHCCSRNCHFHPCHPQCMPICNFSHNKIPCEEQIENRNSPNIVIPLCNISEEALLKIVSFLKF